jgi:hypothetical protein
MVEHSRSITGSTKDWPPPGATQYAWKCVDCHDPHGDGTDANRRIDMIRSAINNPTVVDNTNIGSDAYGRPVKTPSWTNIAFYDNSGLAAGSYAIPGPSNWGICEGCHRQTSVYGQSVDEGATHVDRTNRCTICHGHNYGFAAKSCKGCHGPDSSLANAPVVGAYWTTSGHGKTGIAVDCEACHDVDFLNAPDHKTTVPATSPPTINTQKWPGKSPENADTNPNINTAHLLSGFFYNGASYPTGLSNRYQFAQSFDSYCGSVRAGCHSVDLPGHHWKDEGANPRTVARFGDGRTTSNPKQYGWLPLTSYPVDFYKSRSPWVDIDVSSVIAVGNDALTTYAVCVTCHDPHGTATADTKGAGPLATNVMLRWNWKSDPATFCTKACHTSRTAP